MKNIEIKHLRMLSAIAATGNMTRAAEQLCLSQSALSQQLKDIEHRLGVDLFFRARKKMTLTSAGSKLLATAREVTRLVDEAERDIDSRVAGESGELKVGVQCLFCYKWLPEAVRIFQDRFPGVELVIGTAFDLEEELETGRFDLIITAAPVTDPRFRVVPLFDDEMVCVLPVDHRLTRGGYVDVRDLRHYTFIGHAERSRNRFYQRLLKPLDVEPKRYVTVEQPQAMLEMVVAGLGIGVFPAWAVGEPVAAGRVETRSLTPQGIEVQWKAVSTLVSTVPVIQEGLIDIISDLEIETMGKDAEQAAHTVCL